MQVQYKIFRSTLSSWDKLFSQARDFANSLKPDRLITISHSADQSSGVVVVWFWGRPGEFEE